MSRVFHGGTPDPGSEFMMIDGKVVMMGGGPVVDLETTEFKALCSDQLEEDIEIATYQVNTPEGGWPKADGEALRAYRLLEQQGVAREITEDAKEFDGVRRLHFVGA